MDGTTALGITAAMLEPITSYLNEAVSVSVPVGIGIMAVLIGVGFVPKIIHKFAK